MMSQSLKERWRAGEVTFGAWSFIGDVLAAESMARGPVDWILVDMQHGTMGYETAVNMVRAIDLAGKAPIVRVPVNEPGIIGRMLDAGALGIIIPMIESVDDAKRAVDACLYPPLGRRSFGPIRVGMRDGPAYFLDANERIAVIPMIETKAALAAVDGIAAVPGVDALFVGPFDLSVALGLRPGDNDGEPAFDDALERVGEAAKAHGRTTAILSNAKLAARRAEQGFQMISIFSDVAGLMTALHGDAQAIQEKMKAEKTDA